jgi:hypothetical protein
MEIESMVSLQMQDVAFEAFLAVHKDDHLTCESTGAVPRRLYSGNHKSYIGLRTDKTAAVERAVMLFGKKCHVQKDTILLLRIQFSYQGFTKYATTTLGYDEAFAPMFYKITYPKDTSGTDYGVWAFHGDLPLHERAEDGQVLIACEWMEIIS